MADLRIVLVSRELAPFGGAGIGTYVRSTADALAPIADITLITTDVHEPRYRELAAVGDERFPSGRIVFVPEPRLEDVGNFYGIEHCWSARAYEALLRETANQPADVVEFPDFLGEGFVTVQARRTGDPALRNTAVCVRAYTPGKITAILNGALPTHFYDRATFELERFALANCDRLVWPGGDVLGTYRRWFGDALAAPVRVRHPVSREPGSQEAAAAVGERNGLRMLYLGRLERRKGVHNLLKALGSAGSRDWSLTMVGGDTPTAPLGQSMRGVLERMTGGDPRIDFRDRVEREEIPALLAEHDLVVMPSLWECWPAVGLEALESGVPLLTTPVGGFTEMAQAGRSGWHSAGTGAGELVDAIDPLLESPEQVRELRDSGGPRDLFEELTDPEGVRQNYTEIAMQARKRRPTAAPTVSRIAAGLGDHSLLSPRPVHRGGCRFRRRADLSEPRGDRRQRWFISAP